ARPPTGSTSTFMRPPHTSSSSSRSPAKSTSTSRAKPVSITSWATDRMTPSPHPPPTVPVTLKSGLTSILAPASRGVDPSVHTIVASAERSALFSSSANASNRSFMYSLLPALRPPTQTLGPASAPHLHQLGDDGQSNLLRGFRPDRQADGCVNAVEPLLGESFFRHPA